MANTELTQGSPIGAGTRLRRLAETGLLRLVALWRAAQNRRSVARLLEWDAHMLRDIGLTPGDVRSAMASPMGHDPSSHLHAMALERRIAIRAAAGERAAFQRHFLHTILRRAPLPPISDGRSDRRSA